jgi:glutathione S-transferase
MSSGNVAAAADAAAPLQPQLTLYEAGTSRSARCRWAIAESGVDATFVTARPNSAEARAVHPLGKLPALAVGEGDERVFIFESAAIVTFVCDLAAAAATGSNQCGEPALMIAPAGTMARATHDQWCSFALTELDAHLWHTFIQRFQPEEQKLECTEQDKGLWRRGGAALEAHLAAHDYMLGDAFSATDCVVGWSVNWARRQGLLDGGAFQQISAYVARLLARPLCPLNKEWTDCGAASNRP